MKYLLKLFVKLTVKLGRARWIVDYDGDAGFRIFGVNVICHKWADSFICCTDGGYRLIEKRELKVATNLPKKAL